MLKFPQLLHTCFVYNWLVPVRVQTRSLRGIWLIRLCLECHRHSDADPKKRDRKEDIHMIPLIDLRTGKSGSLVIEATVLVSLVVGADTEPKAGGRPF